jgi:hypothetical protein
MPHAAPAPLRRYLAVVVALIAIQAMVLLAMGRPPICTCGTIRLWVGTVDSPETSQQLTDWYTFSHIIHGILFYGLLWLVLPRAPVGLRLALAVGIEVTWEIVENTPMIIERYRQAALAQGYVGDSVLNSLSDTLSMVVGFLLAHRLPAWASVAIVVGLELFTGAMIRDSLTLNIIQLIAPNDTISRWQTGR